MRGKKVCEDFAKILRNAKDISDLFRCIVPLCGDDADLLELLIKAGEERKKQHPEKIEIAQGNDKERNFVRGFAVKPGDHVVKKLLNDGFLLFENFRKKLSCEISYCTLLKMFFYYINGRIGKYDWKESIVAMIRKHPDLMDEFQRYVSVFDNVQLSRSEVEEEDEVQRIETRGSQDRKREKYPNKSIRLDLSRCKKCTPSYRYLPKDYRVPSKHNAMQPELKVLNDQILLVPSGSKYFSTRKSNENAKIMLECEDNRYEMDMLISWFISAVEYAEELEMSIDDNEMENGNRKIFLWCPERLYGDQGLDHQHSLPLLKVRLEQKLKELKAYKDELGRIWAHAYARN
ncbi:hypothetical protein D5086_030349 [Populus alba]|uniref:Uncharacterized protein n=1 Tax=Populus alba TaxID=43335 RepID=A0ACC4ANB1_POPAL